MSWDEVFTGEGNICETLGGPQCSYSTRRAAGQTDRLTDRLTLSLPKAATLQRCSVI